MKMFTGVITALVTPFKNGQLDLKSFEQLIRHQLDHGIEGFVIAGTTGESPNLSDEEKVELFRLARALVGTRVPLLLGTGSNSTAKTIDLTKKAQSLGADGALVVCPYYNKPPQRGLIEHFRMVAQAVSIPIVLYNVPSRTSCHLSVESILELAQVSNIKGLKEASGSMETAAALLERLPDDFTLISGDDATACELMRLGGDGVISVVSHVIPRPMRTLSDQARRREKVAFEPYLPLTNLMFVESNPIPVKAALHMMGLLETDDLRLPLVRLLPHERSALKHEMQKQGVIA